MATTKEPPAPLKLSPVDIALQQAKKSKEEAVAQIEEASKSLFEIAQENLNRDFEAASYFPNRKMVHSSNLDNTPEAEKPKKKEKAKVNSDGTYASQANEVITEPAAVEEANLITSECYSGLHAPVIDFDIPIESYPSSHVGHNHLYINKEMTWEEYQELLDALVKAGLVEEGYVAASKAKGFTAVRPVGQVKEHAPRTVYVLAENAVLRQTIYDLQRNLAELQARLQEETDPKLIAEYQTLYDNSVALITLNEELAAEVEQLKASLNAIKLEQTAVSKATWT